MKRCPHCGVQDHDEAILCKSCMKSFSAPPERRASASAAAPSSSRPQRQGSPIRLLITLMVFGAIGYSVLHPEVVQELIDRFNEMQAGQSQAAGDEPPAAAATSTDAPPAAAAEPAPTRGSVEPAAASEPAAATPAPAATSAAAPSPVVPAPAPTARRAETRPAPRPAADDRAEARRPEPAPALAESAPPPPPQPPAGPIRVGGNIQAPAKVRDVRPIYPADAQSNRIQGIVIIEATIGTDGRVRDTRVLRSVAMLDDAAVSAVRQWEYEPTLLNGKPVAVIMTVTVNFRLQ